MTATTDERSFLARIAANPADDTDRLVYADWLEESGEPERADYIRTAIAYHFETERTPCTLAHFLAEVKGERVARMSRLERGGDRNILMSRVHPEAVRRLDAKLARIKSLELKLMGSRGGEATGWRRAGACVACRGMGAFVASTRANTLTRDCPACWGSGDIGGLLRTVSAEWNGGGRFGTAVPLRVDFERGFPAAVHCAMSDVVDAAGVPTSWARAVVKYHPVTRFVVGDRTPHEGMPGWQWQCPAADPHGRHPADLPRAVFDSLAGFARDSPAENCRDNLRAVFLARRIYSTRDSANDALYTALARLAAGS